MNSTLNQDPNKVMLSQEHTTRSKDKKQGSSEKEKQPNKARTQTQLQTMTYKDNVTIQSNQDIGKIQKIDRIPQTVERLRNTEDDQHTTNTYMD